MSLDRDGWARVQIHFDALIELEPASREAALQALDLRSEDLRLLRSLIESYEHADPLLDIGSAPVLLALTGDDPADEDWTGRHLGPWQVEEQIGRGGMSVVHRGRRADGQFEKTVAIKVLDADQLAADQRHRLTEEVRILARLEHPGLARLIDSGQSDDGDPYLVMEHVQGASLTDHIAANRPSVGQRIELITQVARALQYAHQRRVIHCDVKPSNILVTAQGQARLVDFGIASLNQGESGSEARLYCSPAYAAPERLLGAPPTTSQDIFALGAVLYRALSGRNIRPHDSITGTDITEQPTPPSIATTRAVNETVAHPIDARKLRGDLDAICMKAIAVDPEDRYASLSEFIADLEAWRDHRPVAARGAGRAYVLARWLRRHTAIAALGLLLSGALIGGALISLDQARRASEQAERAVASRDFLIGILEAADPTLEFGHDPTASELLRRGAVQIQSQLDQQPDLLIELLHIIGKTQLERGLIEDARGTLDRAIVQLGEERDHPDAASILASRGMVAYEFGMYEKSVDWLAQAATVATSNDINREDRHGILIQLADLQAVSYNTDAALALTDEVLSEQPGPGNQVSAMRVRGVALELNDRLKEAEDLLLEALRHQNDINPNHINVAKIENDLGIVYWRQGKLERSVAMHEASWRHKIEIYGEDHPQTQTSLGNIAALRGALGQHGQAEQAWESSLNSLLRVHATELHPDVVYTQAMMALSDYWQDELESAAEKVGRAMRNRSMLVEHPASVRWLEKLSALLAYERGERIELPALEANEAECSPIVERSPLSQRLCSAWWVLTAIETGHCPPLTVQTAFIELAVDWPDRWADRWRGIAANCAVSGEADTLVGEGSESQRAGNFRRSLDPF